MVAHPISLDCGDGAGGSGWYIQSPSTSLAHERTVGAERVASFFRRRRSEAGCPAEGRGDRPKDPCLFAAPDRSTVITPENGTREARGGATPVGDDRI